MGFGDWVGEKWRNVHDTGSKLFGYESYAESDRKEQVQQAEQAHQQQMSQLEQRNSGLQDGVEEYDSPSVTQSVHWDGFSHAQIYQTNQDSIEAGKAGEIAKAWSELGKDLAERGPQFSQDLNNVLGGGWEGEAAERAKSASKPVDDWMTGSGNAFHMTGNNMQTTGDSAGEAKKMVGEPEGFNGWTTGLKVAFAPGGVYDAIGDMEQRQEEEKAARQTMGNVYSPTVTQVDKQMPTFRKPDGSAVEPPPAQPQSPTDWGGGGGATTPANAAPGGGGGMANVSGGGSHPGAPGIGGPGTNGPGSNTPSTNTPGMPGTTPPSTSAPASAMTPAGPGGPGGASTPGGPGGGGAPGGGGVGGVAGGAPGGNSGAGPGPGGRSGVGNSGGAKSGAPGGAGTAAGRGGAAGRGAMGGMGGRGGQGQGEDEEHERPSWLEENDDVWFNDMPKTAPPVLGE